MEIREPEFKRGDKVRNLEDGHVYTVESINDYKFMQDEYWYNISDHLCVTPESALELYIDNHKTVWEVKRISKYDFFTDLYIYELESDEYGISLISIENNLKPYIEKPKSVWNLKKGDKYYCLSEYCKISEFIWDDTPFDKNVLESGNGFLTKEEAEFECERRKIETEMLRLGGRRSFKFNGKNYGMYYSNDLYVKSYEIAYPGLIYFDSKKEVDNAIETIRKDRILKYIFRFGLEE